MRGQAANRPGWRDGIGYLAVAMGYLVLVFSVSHIPGSLFQWQWKPWDKAVHFVEYVPLGVLIGGWLAHRAWAPGSRLALVVCAALVVAALGALDELHQWFVPRRDATWGDALADALGGLLGAVVVVWVFSARGRLRSANPSASRTTW